MNERIRKLLLCLDALGCTIIAKRAKVGEYISTYCWRTRKAWAVKWINKRFDDPDHCRKSFEGQQVALKLEMDPPDCLFCAYGYDEKRAKFDEESA